MRAIFEAIWLHSAGKQVCPDLKHMPVPVPTAQPRYSRSLLALALLLILTTPLSSVSHAKKKSKPTKKSHPAAHNDVGKKESELKKIKAEIEDYKRQLAEHEKNEKHSKQNLSAYNKRTTQLKQMIGKLSGEAEALEAEKAEVDRSIHVTQNHLSTLKQSYAASARYLYVSGALTAPDATSVFSEPSAFQQAQRNAVYAHVIGEAHAMNRMKLDSLKTSLDENKAVITSNLAEERTQIEQRAQEANSVETKKQAEAKQLAQIQKDKEKLRKQLDERVKSAKKLENLIANLVAKEEAAQKAKKNRRKLAEKKPGKHAKPAPEEEEEHLGPAIGPHSLRWPCSSHKVKQGYGEHRNAELNTVTMNLGIDIGTPEGTSVTAAAEGEVSLISSLPSYGTILIMRHSNGLHTVYSGLSSVGASQGSHVKAGQSIGRSGSNSELGATLHFEVWKGKSKQNPMGWLK